MQPLKRGWRWENGSLAYSYKWELEDESRSPLDITRAALRETVRGILRECPRLRGVLVAHPGHQLEGGHEQQGGL